MPFAAEFAMSGHSSLPCADCYDVLGDAGMPALTTHLRFEQIIV
jgi:hypothetical protein